MYMDTLSFDCPRCNNAVEERFYGPCSSCRTALVSTMRMERQEVGDVAYEPKMNVTPNQVATKE